MIRITGNRGEGVGLITALAIKSVLSLNHKNIVFLIDDTSEFIPLGRELNAQFIDVHRDMSKCNTFDIVPVADNLDLDKRFFIFNTYNCENSTLCTEILFAQLDNVKNNCDRRVFFFTKVRIINILRIIYTNLDK